MKTHATSHIRNVAFVGHGHCGKTSLTEALLFSSGAIKRLGSTDAGTSVTDHGEDEHERKISIRVGFAHFEEGDVKVNVLDAPGYGNFLFEAKVAMSAADTAVILVDAVAGIEVQTERVWAFGRELGLPSRVIVLSKMDRENADFDRVLGELHERYGREAVPVQVPIGTAHDFRGVVNLVSGKAYLSPGDGSAAVEVGAPPPDLLESVTAKRTALMEMVAESSEELMEKFLEAGELSEADLRSGLRKAVAAGEIYPVCCVSGLKMIGVQAFARVLADLTPDPGARAPRTGIDGEQVRRCTDDEPASLQVFKTLLDPFAGHLSLFRIWSGSISSDGTYLNTKRDHDERAVNLVLLQGKDQERATEMLHAGDIGCLAKLKETHTGDTLADKAHPIQYETLEPPEPMMSFAIEAKNLGDEDKIASALHRIEEEDQMVRFRLDPQTKELVISGAGERHVRAVCDRLKERFKVEVVLHPPRVPYRETITQAASGSYRHRKQSGGSGQFAEVHMEIKPQPRGEGFVYDTKRVFGGSISQNFFPSIEKGIRQVLDRGPIAACEVVDVRCEVFDGKMHPVDSKDIAFQIAGRSLMRDLMLLAKPILLEPIMKLDATVPEESMGDVMGDISGKRGRVQGMVAEGGRQVIEALVPLAELLSYEVQIKSLTGGRGTFHMEFDHYDQVPANLQQKISEDAKHHAHDDEEG